jgi:hypothetical protein
MMHQGVAQRGKAAGDGFDELLAVEREGGLQDPGVRPAVVAEEVVDHLQVHGASAAGLSVSCHRQVPDGARSWAALKNGAGPARSAGAVLLQVGFVLE